MVSVVHILTSLCQINKMVAKIVRIDRYETELFYLQNIRWIESYYFNPLLTLIFGMSTFCSNYNTASLWHSINIFPENFNTNIIPCLLQLKPKAFVWMHQRSVQLIFQLAPNLLDGVEVCTLRGSVHHFQYSRRFLSSQVVIAVVCFMGIIMANSTKTTETS